MRYQLSIGGQTSILDPALSFFGSDGLHYSSAVLGAFSDNDLAAIGVTKVADAPPAVPDEVGRMQGLEALRLAGLLGAANAAVAAATADVQLWFANTPVFRRTNDKLLTIATAMGLTPAQVDALFIVAGQVVV